MSGLDVLDVDPERSRDAFHFLTSAKRAILSNAPSSSNQSICTGKNVLRLTQVTTLPYPSAPRGVLFTL